MVIVQNNCMDFPHITSLSKNYIVQINVTDKVIIFKTVNFCKYFSLFEILSEH
jgi:hypothetical protein